MTAAASKTLVLMDSPAAQIETLTPEMIEQHLDTLKRLSADIPGDYWELPHYLHPLPGKWHLSRAAFLDGALVGFMICSQKPGAIHLNRIAVDRGLQGSGVGRLLMGILENNARTAGAPLVTLKVLPSNSRALRFYELLDYAMSGEEGGHLMLSKRLADVRV